MNAPTLTFRGKPEPIWHGEVRRLRLKVPEIKRGHCDMQAFRNSREFGGYANSDLFLGILARKLRALAIPAYLYADDPLPVGVAIDTSGFLWSVTITFPES